MPADLHYIGAGKETFHDEHQREGKKNRPFFRRARAVEIRIDTAGSEWSKRRAFTERIPERHACGREEIDREMDAAPKADARDDVTDRPCTNAREEEAEEQQRKVRIRAMRER